MPRKKKRNVRLGRPGFLARLSIDQIRDEIGRRHDLLLGQRAELERQIEAISAEIAQFDNVSGQTRRRGRGRPPGPGVPTARGRGRGRSGRGSGGAGESLPVLLHSLLRGKTMSVQEMAEAAKKAGYKSKSKNFRVVVSLAMLKNRRMFKRVARGQYTAK